MFCGLNAGGQQISQRLSLRSFKGRGSRPESRRRKRGALSLSTAWRFGSGLVSTLAELLVNTGGCGLELSSKNRGHWTSYGVLLFLVFLQDSGCPPVATEQDFLRQP